jgi:ATP-binding cassette subfamily B protein
VSQTSLRAVIAYVPQEPLLFHRSLFQNIAYGTEGATKEQVVNAAKLARSDEFIRTLPHAYETLVGERGIKLSGGQRQRVAIARAILKNAPILILDEATSSLDSESEKYIQEGLWELMKNKTAIVIAHRLSTIRHLDRIVVLEQGKIVQDGTHEDLIEQDGLYAQLWRHQSGGFLEE